MKELVYIILITFLFNGCVPKIEKIEKIENSKIENELIKDLNRFSSNDIELNYYWWKNFKDKQLNDLISNAIKNAPTLKQLEAKYQKANNIIKSRKAKNLPNIKFDSNLSRQRFSENYIFPDPLGGDYYNLYQTELNLQYNFDFWDERKSLINVSKYEALAQNALMKVKELEISTSISKLYISWYFQNKEIEEIKKIKNLVKEKHHILNKLFELGLINKKEINQSNFIIEKINQNILDNKEQIINIKKSIAIIAGILPSKIEKLNNPSILKDYKIYIPKDIHLDVVSHLPQIAVQKYLIKSKESYIKNAKAKFYPNISLVSLINFTSFPFSELFSKSSFSPQSSVALSLPIFDAKKREANLNSKVNDYNAQVYEYNNTIIKSVNEIVSILKRVNLNKEQQKSENLVLFNKNKNKDIEKKIFNLGLKNKIAYIDMEINVENEKLKNIALKNKEFQLQVDLIKSLGGGYKEKGKNIDNK